MNNKVSVALAVYNPNYAFLKKQLISILNQTVIPNKIVIVDDCSKEPKKIRFLITSILNGKIDFIFSRNNINLGYSKTFKKISKYIDGEIIFFSDQDDIWFNNKIELVLKEFKKKEKPLSIIHDCFYLKNKKIYRNITKLKFINYNTGSNLNFVAGSCTAIDKKLLSTIHNKIFDQINFDDLIHRVSNLIGKRLVMMEKLIIYRRHEKNTSKIIENDPDNFKYNLNLILRKKIINIIKDFLLYRYYILSLEELIFLKDFIYNNKINTNKINLINFFIIYKSPQKKIYHLFQLPFIPYILKLIILKLLYFFWKLVF